MSDPILNAAISEASNIFDFVDDADIQYDEPYGLGNYENVAIKGVEACAPTQYGHTVLVKVWLKGDEEKLEWTYRAQLPQSVPDDAESWIIKRQAGRLDEFNKFLVMFDVRRDDGKLCQLKGPIDTQEQYDTLVNVLAANVGAKQQCGVFMVKRDGKNKPKEDGGWDFIPNGYTKAAFKIEKKRS